MTYGRTLSEERLEYVILYEGDEPKGIFFAGYSFD